MLAAFALPAALASDGLRGTLFTLGLMGLIFGGFGALVFQQAVKAKRKLARGDGILARWHLSAAQWRAFLALDAERNAQGERRRNEFSPREEIPEQGVDIVVGDEAIQIDGSLHVLPRHGSPEVTRFDFDDSRVRAPVIEFDLTYPGGGHGASGVPQAPTYSLLRFPVPEGGQVEAQRIVAHFGQLSAGKPTFFHGRGDGSDPEDLSTCWKCGLETHRFVSTCERCGAPMQSKRWVRRFGGVLVVLGALLSIGMLVLALNMMPMLLHPGQQVGNSRFTGSPGMALMILGILGAVAVFGVTALGYGIYQLVSGRRALLPARIMMVIAGALYLLAIAMRHGWV
ncbi:MAG: hypothetical protein ABI588_05525 [Arenimonas sp.]